MAESEEELKSLLMKVKEGRGKVGLKLNIQKSKIMASGPITCWQVDGKTEATLLSLSVPKRGKGDSGTIRNSCEKSTKSQLQLKEQLNRWGNSVRLYFGGAPKSLQMVIAAMKLKDAYSLEEKL